MSARFADLVPRVASASVMVAVGAVEIWVGGPAFVALVVAACGVMIWELARMLGVRGAAALGGGAAGAVLLMSLAQGPVGHIGLSLLPGVAAYLLWRAPAPLRVPAALYAGAIMLACLALIGLRAEAGAGVILWLVLVVVASDVAGYFAGRVLGGPKFWPAISPKKTWSGTVAGWVGAVLVGAGFVVAGQGGASLLILSPLVALAGQMGDITESWFKRRAGVKDSSALIPGHGGVLDRFDALLFAALAVGALHLVVPVPVQVGG